MIIEREKGMIENEIGMIIGMENQTNRNLRIKIIEDLGAQKRKRRNHMIMSESGL